MNADLLKFLSSLSKVDWTDKKSYQMEPCREKILRYPNTHIQKTTQCKKNARFYLNGLPLCELHTGRALIAALLKDQPATQETSSAILLEESAFDI